jgi:GNAT superfamily N-acetyltransferase
VGYYEDYSSMSIIFRAGTLEDNAGAFRVHAYAIADLFQRQGVPGEGYPPAPDELQHDWERQRSLYEHLTRTAEHFWVAEQDGEIVGYSRASNHGGVRQLNEFFVLPDVQAKGVGKELLARAFAGNGVQLRLVIATPNIRAQSLYMRSGVYARGLIYHFTGVPQPRAIATDLIIECAPAVPETLPLLAAVDRQILGFQRDNDHRWLMAEQQAWLYRRQGQVVGYGYSGTRCGPFALLNPADFPAVLAHAEQQVALTGGTNMALWVHSASGFTLSPFAATLLSDVPFGRLDHYVNTDPPFLI